MGDEKRVEETDDSDFGLKFMFVRIQDVWYDVLFQVFHLFIYLNIL